MKHPRRSFWLSTVSALVLLILLVTTDWTTADATGLSIGIVLLVALGLNLWGAWNAWKAMKRQ